MKKLLALLLAAILVFAMTACGSGGTESKTENNNENETEYNEGSVENEEPIVEEKGVPEGWEQVEAAYLPEGMAAYINPDVLRYVKLSGGFSNAKGADSMVVSVDIIKNTTVEDYMNKKYNDYTADTMNPKQNVALSETETYNCAGYTVHKATISYDAKSYDMSSATDKTKQYTPEEMDKLFPIIWEPKTAEIELVEIADGIYMKTSVTVGNMETFLENIVFESSVTTEITVD